MKTVRLGPNEEKILTSISDDISQILSKVGLFNRVFARIKSEQSILKKLEEKERYYKEANKKIQDIFGFRVTVYFQDDEDIAINLIKEIFEEIPDSHSIDPLLTDQFGPQRRNLVFRIKKEIINYSKIFDEAFFDSAFEVQFRTILSEGWHEVEHDLRYKCKEDWICEPPLNRQLNGVLASLESSNWATLKIFDELAYKKYKAQEWSSFFRNRLRIRFENLNFSNNISKFLTENISVAKQLLKSDRISLIYGLSSMKVKLPLTMDNVLFLLNRSILKSPDLSKLEPPLLTRLLDNSIFDPMTLA